MKKFSFKSLLILMLVLLLAFSLVACNKDNSSGGGDNGGGSSGGGGSEPQDPNAIETSEFFKALWNGANSIGADSIADTDDIAISLDLGIGIDVVDYATSKTDESVTVGVNVQLVYDRNMEHTAAKVQLYNPSTKKNWVTLYYFLDDPYNAYIDFADQHIKFYFETGFNQENWADAILGYATTDVLGDLSISEIISMIADTTKDVNDDDLSDFSLNKLLAVIIDMAGGEKVMGILNQLNSFLKIPDNEFYEDENKTSVNLESILSCDLIAGLLSNTRCVVDEETGVKNYSTNLAMATTYNKGSLVANSELSLLSSIINNIKIGDKTLIDYGVGYDTKKKITTLDGTVLGINFGIEEETVGNAKINRIDGFGLTLDLKGFKYKEGSGKNIVSKYPRIDININDLNVAPVNASYAETEETGTPLSVQNALGFVAKDTNEKDIYTENLTFDIAIDLNTTGISLNTGIFDDTETTLPLDGDYRLRASLAGNLGKEKDVYLNVYFAKVLDKGAKNETESKAIEILYNGETIILKLDDTVKAGNQSIVEAFFDCLGGFIYEAMVASEDENISGNNEEIGFAGHFKNAFLTETDGVYSYKGEDAAKIAILDLDLLALFQYGIDAINDALPSSEGTSTAASTEEYPLFVKNIVTLVQDVTKIISTDGGKQLGVKLSDSLLTYINKWFYLGNYGASDANNNDEWYARAIAYNQTWVDAFIACGYFETDYMYQSVTRDVLNEMWTIAKEYAEAADADKNSVFTKYQAKFKKKQNVTYTDFAAAMDKINLLFGDKFVKITGESATKSITSGKTTTTIKNHWYNWLFDDLRADVVISLEDGVSVNIDATIANATAKLSLKVDVIDKYDEDTTYYEYMKSEYEIAKALTVDEDFGEITGLD